MKKCITILLIGMFFLVNAQENYLGLRKLPIDDLRIMTPDINFTTLAKDSILSGEIVDICENLHSHHIGQILGVIKLKAKNYSGVYQILFYKNKLIKDFQIGEIVTLKVSPYSPTDKKLMKTTGLTCNAITGLNLCILINKCYRKH